jgi:PAS domain S-box-containing protein
MESILEQLFPQADAAVVAVDSGHRVLAWNPGAERILGWSPAEATGRDASELLAPEDSPFRRYIGSALLGDVIQGVPVTLRRKDGGTIELLLNCRAVRPETGERPTGILFLDPAPRQQSVHAGFAQLTRELQSIMGAFPDLFFWADSNGRMLDYFAGSTVEFKRPLHEILGHKPVDIIEGEAGERLQAAIATALEEQRTVRSEVTFVRDDGSRLVEARVVPIGPDRVVAILRDITDQRRQDEERRRTQKLEAIGRLAGGVAHDFNNLLTVMQGCVATLQAGAAEPSEEPEVLDELKTATDKAASLVRQLLAFGRRQPASAQVVDVNALVLDNLRLLARLTGEAVVITLDLTDQPAYTLADPVQLEQVLYNLCTNARDAMPSGGSLTLRTEVKLVGGDQGATPMVALAVIDTGVGMDADTLNRVFEPFFTTKREKGSGLGLATAHSIVQGAGGRIDVSSTVGKGTVITVLLPNDPAGRSSGGPTEPASALPLHGSETVLVIEDNDAVRRMVAGTLRRQGYQVIEAGDAAAGLRLYAEHRDAIRLVISDVIMPGQSGFEVVATLRRDQPHLPIVLMSGYHTAGPGAEPSMPPGTVFVRKPLAPDRLLRVVRAAIDTAGESESEPASH